MTRLLWNWNILVLVVFSITSEAAILLKDKEEYDAHKASDVYKLRETHNEFLSKPTAFAEKFFKVRGIKVPSTDPSRSHIMKIRFPRKHLEKIIKQANPAKPPVKVPEPPQTPPKHPDYVEIDDVLRIQDPTDFTFEQSNRLDENDNKRIKKGAGSDADSESQTTGKTDQVGVENETEAITTMPNEEKTTDVTSRNMDNSTVSDSNARDSSDIGTESTERNMDSTTSEITENSPISSVSEVQNESSEVAKEDSDQRAAGDMTEVANADENKESADEMAGKSQRESDSSVENVTSMAQESVTMAQSIESNEQKPMEELASPIAISENEQSMEALNELTQSGKVGDSLAVTEPIIGNAQEITQFNVNQQSENTEVLEIAVGNAQEMEKIQPEENSVDGNTGNASMPTEPVNENEQRAMNENENSDINESTMNEPIKTDPVEGDNSPDVNNELSTTDDQQSVIEKKANEVAVGPNQSEVIAMQTGENSSPMPVSVIAMDDVQPTDARESNKEEEEMDNTLVNELKVSSVANVQDDEINRTQSEIEQTDISLSTEPLLGSTQGEQIGEKTSKPQPDTEEEQQKTDKTEMEEAATAPPLIETTLSPTTESNQDTKHEASTAESTENSIRMEEEEYANLGSVQQLSEEKSTEGKKLEFGTTESARAAEEVTSNSEAPVTEPTVGVAQQLDSQSIENIASATTAPFESNDQKSTTVEVTESASIEIKAENANQEDSKKESDAALQEGTSTTEPLIGIQQISNTAENIAVSTELPSTPTQQTTTKPDIVTNLDEGKSTTTEGTKTKTDIAASKTSEAPREIMPTTVSSKTASETETTITKLVTSTPKPQQTQVKNATDKPVNKTEPLLHGIHPLIQRVMLGSPNPTPNPKPLHQFFEHLQKRAPLLASFFKIRSFAQQPILPQQPQQVPTQAPEPTTQQPPKKKNVKRDIADSLIITPKPFDSFNLSPPQGEDSPLPKSLLHQYFSLSSGERAVKLSNALEKAMHALTVASHVDGYLTHRLGTTIKKAHKIFVPSEEQQ